MKEKEKNVPTLQTFEEIGRVLGWEQYSLDIRENISEPYYMLEINGIGCCPKGDLQAGSGQKKNGKSNLNVIFMAVILGSKKFPGIQVPKRTRDNIGHAPSVLYCDTEQSKLSTIKVARRVHWLNDWPLNEPNERFNVLCLRNIEDDGVEKAYQKRLKIIRNAIEDLKPDAVFIDGIRDLIGDFNNNEQATELISSLMVLAQKNDIMIWCTLHMNPRPGNDDESKMRGHLGTELGNKVSDTFRCTKNKTSNPPTFKVSQIDARGKDVDDFTFIMTDDAGNLGIPKIIDTPVSEDTDEDLLTDEIINALRDILPSQTSLKYGRVREQLMKRFDLTKGQCDKVIKTAIKYKVLNEPYKIGNQNFYSFNKNFGEDNALPFV